MIDFDEIFPIIIAIIVAVVLFFGVITAIQKAWKSPTKSFPIDSRMQIKEQRRLMDDIRRRQKQLLRDQKQKLRDMQRR